VCGESDDTGSRWKKWKKLRRNPEIKIIMRRRMAKDD
jgi:hypothetical protein